MTNERMSTHGTRTGVRAEIVSSRLSSLSVYSSYGSSSMPL